MKWLTWPLVRLGWLYSPSVHWAPELFGLDECPHCRRIRKKGLS